MSDQPTSPAGAPRASWRERAWLLFAALGSLVVVGSLTASSPVVADVFYVGLSAGVAGAVVLGVLLHRPAQPLPWFVMALGQLSWVLADATLYWQYDVMHVDAYPSISDAFYLAGYAVLATSLLLMLRARGHGRDLPGLLDSLTVSAGLAVLCWAFLTEPTLSAYADRPGAAAVSAAYPLADIALIAVLIRLVVSSAGRSRSLRLILVALALLIVADGLTAAAELYVAGPDDLTEMIWLASYVTWGAGALHPSMASVTESNAVRRRPLRAQRLVAMVLATLVTPGILAVQTLAGLRLSVWAVVVGSVVMFLLVLARMDIAINQIAAMSRQRRLLQEELHHQASHDALTGLPNRAQALLLVNQALERAGRTGDGVTVLFVDLDGFKGVNDTLGHRAGDEVLRVVARRLASAVRHGDVAARLGGDEFVVMLESAAPGATPAQVAERIIDAVSETITLRAGGEVRVGASVGIASSVSGDVTADELVHDADQALYRAKAEGKGRHVVFGEALREELSQQAQLEVALRHAIGHEELRVHYQPILDVVRGELQGYEALVRWERPGVGLLPPSEFLPMAESSDLICELDTWVLGQATNQLAAWCRAAGRDDLVVAVNVSGRHVSRRRFCDDVVRAVEESGIRPQQLVVEVTETALAEHRTAVANLTELRLLGVAVSLDDFGTGYSSIGQLSRLPVDIVKIAREYLEPGSAATRKLLELMVQAAHSAGLPVVGEGVERLEQLEVLQELGCESAQGFYLGRPTSGEQLRTPTVSETLEATA
ncbi:MAG TPA: EAL domain-containing protein [Marmoricola sp.]|nr:EAL domain-containing protein [Marmoricola sp.]